MKNIFFLALWLYSSSLACAQSIAFTENELYPEGIAYSKQLQTFFVSSMHYGKIGKVDKKGNYTVFADDPELISSVGLLLDEQREVLYACVSDPGTAVKTSANTQRKVAKVIAFSLSTGSKKFTVDLAKLHPESSHFANDLTIDTEGNLYVTNSFTPVIYKVTPQGKTTTWATSPLWEGEGFNLNGITYHPAGFILAMKMNSGDLFKIDLKKPANITQVKVAKMVGGDGLVLNDDKTLVVIANESGKLYKVESQDSWQSGEVVATKQAVMSFPTTGVQVEGKNYILNAKLNEIFDEKTPNTSDFLIQEVVFEK
ncbi:MAG: gluconolaconase [Thermonemataceae bacterium]